MDRKILFCLDLEENMEYLLLSNIGDAVFTSKYHCEEYQFGTIFMEYMNTCLERINNLVSNDLNEVKKYHGQFVDLFKKSMIESLNTINNDETKKDI